VAGLDGTITAVAAGGLHSVALTAYGGVFTWGCTADGQCGTGIFMQDGVYENEKPAKSTRKEEKPAESTAAEENSAEQSIHEEEKPAKKAQGKEKPAGKTRENARELSDEDVSEGDDEDMMFSDGDAEDVKQEKKTDNRGGGANLPGVKKVSERERIIFITHCLNNEAS
jgi:hypothetical protein